MSSSPRRGCLLYTNGALKSPSPSPIAGWPRTPLFSFRSLLPQGPPSSSAPAAVFSLATHAGSLLRVTGTLLGHTCTFLVDCGASNDFVSSAFILRHALSLEPTSRTVRGYDGTVTLSPGLLRAPLLLTSDVGSFADRIATRAFTTATLHGEDAILGLPWLRSINPAIDWIVPCISTCHDGITHRLQPAPVALPGTGKGTHLGRLVAELYRVSADSSPARDGSLLELLSSPTRSNNDSESTASPPPALTAPRDPLLDPLRERAFSDFPEVFPDDLPAGLPPSRGIEHVIELKPGLRPPARAGLRTSRSDSAGIDAFVEENLKKGFIRPSQSAFSAIPFQVGKKDSTERRTVVDFRALNEQTVKSKYPLPRMDELFDRLQGAKYFSKLDLRTGFHQILIAEADRHKTAFRTARGLFEYCVLAMGLCNAPGTFMQVMNETMDEFLNKFVLVFLDDIIIFSNSLEEHQRHVAQVLARLRDRKLYAKRSKCTFYQREVEFLGHHVGVNGLRVMEDKLEAVSEWPTPRNVRDVRAFLGLVGFYRRFVREFSRVALPLTTLTRTVTGAPFSWGPSEQLAFDALKQGLRSAPVLLLPDPTLPYVVHTDASGFATGAVLQQDQGAGLQPIAFLSHKMSDAETRYPVHEQELLAIIHALSAWSHYLTGTAVPFRILTDHKSLIHFQTQPMLSGRQVRWLEKLANFDFVIEYIKGPTNVVADALSRRADHQRDRAIPIDRPPQFVDTKQQTATLTELAQCFVFHLSDSSVTADLQLIHAAQRQNSRQAELQRQQARKAAREAAMLIQDAADDRPQPNAAGARVTATQRCTAENKRGTQCGSRTAKGQYCWTHLRAIEGVRIKLSSILGAGFGLHAARNFQLGEHIADYTGDRLSLRNASDGGPYCLQMTQREAIDAARTNSASGRWANDPRGSGHPPNASFVVNTRRRTGRLIASRAVRKGEEIYVSYGPTYWTADRKLAKRLAASAAPAAINEISTFNSPLAGMIEQACGSDPAYTELLASLALADRPESPFHASAGRIYRADRLCIPASAELRTQLIRECHDAPTSGHFGKDKTSEQLKRRFYWKGMDADILRYVTTCDACQRNKPSQQATMGLLHPLPIPDHAGQVWSMDLITALPRSRSGYDAVVVFVDKFTKLVHFVPCLTTVTAPQLAQIFMDSIVRLHGLPEALISDRDPRFTAHFWRSFWAHMGTTLLMSTAYHPQTDGQTERANRTLETMLRSRVNFAQDDWDQHLAAAELACNTAVSPTTGYTPFFLCHGRHARLPLDAAIAPLSAPDNPAAHCALQRWRAALQQARSNTEVAQQRQAHYADQHRRPASFAVGDRVMLATKHIQLLGDAKRTRKLTSPFIGPYLVKRVINDNAYELQLPATLRIHPTINISQLKAYHDGSDAFPFRPQPHSRPEPVSNEDNGAPSYDVERILDKRSSRRRTQYLVLWKGYPLEEATWEPLAHLAGSSAAIADYESGAASAPQRRRRSAR